MSLFGFDLIEPCIDKTKKFLFPIDKVLWLKLAVVAFFAGSAYSGPNFNFRFPSGTQPSSLQSFWVEVAHYWNWILFAVFVIIVITFISILVRSVFNFLFFDSVDKKRCLIGKSFSDTHKKSFSYFYLDAFFALVFFLLFFALAYPVIAALFGDPVNFSFVVVKPLLFYLVPSFLLLFLVMAVVRFVLFNLVMPEVYLKGANPWHSLKCMFRLAFSNLKQVIVFIFAKFVLGIVAALLSLVAVLLFGIVAVLVVGFVGLFGYGFYLLSPALIVPLIVLGVVLGVLLFVLFLYVLEVVLLPIPVFFTYYRLEFYRSLVKGFK